MPNHSPLYSVKGYKGAHVLRGVRVTAEFGETADLQLIGASLPFSVPCSDVQTYTQAEAMTEGDAVTLLAQEAVLFYGQDPARVQRAADLARKPYAVQNAQRDEAGEGIPRPSLSVMCVKGQSSGWYVVRPGSCTCPDHKNGNTCKHRIAAWMHRELIIRPLAKARRTTPAQILAELEA